MDFGFTLKAEHSIDRTVALTKQAEAAGFSHGWFWDNHMLWMEIYPLLTLMATATTTMRLGACVTNPTTRHPTVTASVLSTLNEISDGRMELGMGRGDGAVRLLNQPPTTVKRMEEAVTVIRELVAGRTVEYHEAELALPWTREWDLPVWVAGYGPRVLDMTGRVADGLILQLADPDLIRWMASMAYGAAKRVDRDPASLKLQAAAPAHVGPIEECRERVRWFPALVANHVVDLVNRYPREHLPESLVGYVEDRESYDYKHHAQVGSSNADYVDDDVTDRFSIIGEPEEHVRRLLELHEAGVDQFNLYLMSGDEEEQLEIYGSTIIPAVKAAVGKA